MPLYLITYSNGRNPDTANSLRAAKALARQVSPTQYLTRGPDGDWYGYYSRRDLAADSHGDAPHLIQAIVRPISNPQQFLADVDQPSGWLETVRQAVQ
jgi:hypothetical protein